MPGSSPVRHLILCAFAFVVLVGCGDGDDDVEDSGAAQVETAVEPTDGAEENTTTSAPASADQDGGDDEDGGIEVLFPDVISASAELGSDGTWTFSATLSSPYDTPERYADGWRVLGPDGTVYGTRPLAHDHQAEQPFTRTQSGIEIPEGITEVTVEGRDQVSGWGGATVQVTLNR